MFGWNVVFYGCLELLLTEGRPCDTLDFIVGESSGQETAHNRVIIVTQLHLRSIITD